MSGDIFVTGTGRTRAEAESDARLKAQFIIDDRETDRTIEKDHDFSARASIGMTMMAVMGYLMLAASLIGIAVTRPIPAAVLAALVGSVGLLGYEFLMADFNRALVTDGLETAIGYALWNLFVLIAGSRASFEIAKHLPDWALRIERLETSLVIFMPFYVRSPVMLAILTFPTLLTGAYLARSGLADLPMRVGEMHAGDWLAYSVIQALVLFYRTRRHPLAEKFTFWGRAKRPASAPTGQEQAID